MIYCCPLDVHHGQDLPPLGKHRVKEKLRNGTTTPFNGTLTTYDIWICDNCFAKQMEAKLLELTKEDEKGGQTKASASIAAARHKI